MGFIRTVVKLAAAGAAVSMLLKANRDRKASMGGSPSSAGLSPSGSDATSGGGASGTAWPFPRGRDADGADAGGMSSSPSHSSDSGSMRPSL